MTRRLLDAAGVAAAVGRLAEAVGRWAAGEASPAPPALVGIRSRGVPLAERIARAVRDRGGPDLPLGVLDIALYRDDFTEAHAWPEVRESRIPFDVGDRVVVLVDDVLYTGRTIRAALNSLMDFGRPRAVRLAVLVDRGGRELPIRADAAGLETETAPGERVFVRLAETDGLDEVVVETRP